MANLKDKIRTMVKALEQEKIERYAFIVAQYRVHDTLPEDLTAREFKELALWEAILNRAGEIQADLIKQMGVVAIIEPSALAPREETDVQDSE